MHQQQTSFLQQHLAALQSQQLSSNTNLTSVAHASILGIQSALISLRVREIGSGPIELIKPCQGYISQEEVDDSASTAIPKPITIFSQNDRKKKTKVKLPDGSIDEIYTTVLKGTYTGTSPSSTLSYSTQSTKKSTFQYKEWDDDLGFDNFHTHSNSLHDADEEDDDEEDIYEKESTHKLHSDEDYDNDRYDEDFNLNNLSTVGSHVRFNTFHTRFKTQAVSSWKSVSKQFSKSSNSSSGTQEPHHKSYTTFQSNQPRSKQYKKKPKKSNNYNTSHHVSKYQPGSLPKTGHSNIDAFLHKYERTVTTTSLKPSQTSMKNGNIYGKSTFTTLNDRNVHDNYPKASPNHGHAMKTFQSQTTSQQSLCTMRSITSSNGVRDIQCLPTATSCPTSTAIGSNTLWTITRVPFSDVPSSSLFLAESMSNLNYDMDYASINTYPFMIGQMGLRNFSPFEQFLTAKSSKVVTNAAAFTWLVGITPSAVVTFGDIPSLILGPISTLINNLLQPLITFLDSIIPGIADIIPDIDLPSISLTTVGLEIPLTWGGTITHTESQDIVVSYSVTAPPQAHVLGRAIAHMGKSSVPFTLDVTRRVHVPAGIYGQTSGQLIAYDYRIPGVYEGARLVNTEFLIDTI